MLNVIAIKNVPFTRLFWAKNWTFCEFFDIMEKSYAYSG